MTNTWSNPPVDTPHDFRPVEPAQPEQPAGAEQSFAQWAIVELMGHRRLAGYLTEQELAGKGFLRLDVPGPNGATVATQLYSPAAVYCITPTTEDLARRVAAASQPEPVRRWELEAAPAPRASGHFETDAHIDRQEAPF
jgi:hypothetical protein